LKYEANSSQGSYSHVTPHFFLLFCVAIIHNREASFLWRLENVVNVLQIGCWLIKSKSSGNQVLKAVKVQNNTGMKAYKVLARPLLSYGNEAWTIRIGVRTAFYIPEMTFLRKSAGIICLLNHKINELITEEPKIKPTSEYVQRYGRSWLHHVNRLERPRLRKQMLPYVPRQKLPYVPRQMLHYIPSEDGKEEDL
jgi:hypothetical protein